VAVDDDAALEGVELLARTEGIIPALESAHAVIWVKQAAEELEGKTVLILVSGRGDKDVEQIGRFREERL
jgi:tryptophan synthase beta chain